MAGLLPALPLNKGGACIPFVVFLGLNCLGFCLLKVALAPCYLIEFSFRYCPNFLAQLHDSNERNLSYA